MRKAFSHISFAFLVMFVFMLPFGNQRMNYCLGGFILFMLPCITDLKTFLINTDRKYEKWFIISLLLYITIEGLSILWSTDKSRGIQLFLRYISIGLVPYFMYVARKNGVIKYKNLLIAALVVGTTIATLWCFVSAVKKSIYFIDDQKYAHQIHNATNATDSSLYNFVCAEFDTITILPETRYMQRFWLDTIELLPKQSITSSFKTQLIEKSGKAKAGITVRAQNQTFITDLDICSDSIGEWTLHTNTFTNTTRNTIKFYRISLKLTADNGCAFRFTEPMVNYGSFIEWLPNIFQNEAHNHNLNNQLKHRFNGKTRYIFEPIKREFWDNKSNKQGIVRVMARKNTHFTYTDLCKPMHPAYIGLCVVFVIVILLYVLIFVKHNALLNLIYLLLVLYFTLFLFFTQSRANYLALFTAFLTFAVVVAIKQRKVTKTLTIIGVLTLCFLLMLRSERFTLLVQHAKNCVNISIKEVKVNRNELQNVNTRFYLWSNALNIVQQHPLLGAGIGDSEKEMIKQLIQNNPKQRQYNPHNQYLQTATETGVVGLLLLMFIIGIPIAYAIKRRKYLYLIVIVVVAVNLAFECMLFRLSGVMLITPLLYIFMIRRTNNPKDWETRKKLGLVNDDINAN
ncbi:MAG: O-antigen ligase family protein [Salinivirgaceae bacterium]|nr:O-antigen ligase family protein [Salinivirgaceae bacterium]